MLGALPAPHRPLQAPACPGGLRSGHPANPKGGLRCELVPLLPPKAAPQGAAGHRTPTGHPGGVRAGLRGCSSASRWEECPQQAPAKLPVLGGTRHKLLTDLCERLQPPEPCGNCEDTWLCSPALAEQAPQAMGLVQACGFWGCWYRTPAGAEAGASPVPRLRLCKPEVMQGRWLQRGEEVVAGDPVLGLMAPCCHTERRGRGQVPQEKWDLQAPARPGFLAKEIPRAEMP